MTLRRGWALAALLLLAACASSKGDHASPTPTRACTPNCSPDTIQIRPLIAAPTTRSGACPNPRSNPIPRTAIGCDATRVYQVGLIVVSGTDVLYAEPEAPSAPGVTGWAVQLTLSPRGQADLATYTSLHNLGGASVQAADPTSCTPTGKVLCANYLAFIVGGSIVSVSATIDAITGGSVVFGGGFTEARARSLAASAAP